MSAFDPKRTYRRVQSTSVDEKLVGAHPVFDAAVRVILVTPAVGAEEIGNPDEGAVVFNQGANSPIDLFRGHRFSQKLSHSHIPGGADVMELRVGGADDHWNEWIVASIALSQLFQKGHAVETMGPIA